LSQFGLFRDEIDEACII